MTEIGIIASVVCVCALVTSAVNVIIPTGNTQRLINTIVGVFVLCCIIVPIKNFAEDFNFDTSIIADTNAVEFTDNSYNQTVISQTQSNLEATVISYLTKEGIDPQEVKVSLKVGDDGGIYVESVNIYISNNTVDISTKITDIIKDKLGVEPIVTVR